MLNKKQIVTLAEADGWKYDGSHWGFSRAGNFRRLEDFDFTSGFDAIVRLRQNLGIKTEIGLETTPEELALDTVAQIEKRHAKSGA